MEPSFEKVACSQTILLSPLSRRLKFIQYRTGVCQRLRNLPPDPSPPLRTKALDPLVQDFFQYSQHPHRIKIGLPPKESALSQIPQQSATPANSLKNQSNMQPSLGNVAHLGSIAKSAARRGDLGLGQRYPQKSRQILRRAWGKHQDLWEKTVHVGIIPPCPRQTSASRPEFKKELVQRAEMDANTCFGASSSLQGKPLTKFRYGL